MCISAIFAIEYFFCAYSDDINSALFVAGLLSAALSILVSSSTLVALPAALKSDSLQAMPMDIIVASFASCVLWTLLGVMLGDPWVTIPNGTGLAVGIVQLLVVAYRKRASLVNVFIHFHGALEKQKFALTVFRKRMSHSD